MGTTAAIIQARTGSSRLPGKVMYPLAGKHVLERVVKRVSAADRIDTTVVATSERSKDDIVERYAQSFGATPYRGPEEDVLTRLHGAATKVDAMTIVRITGDCPLIDPRVINAVVARLEKTRADYAANIIERTFPRGLDVEAFTMESFDQVHQTADKCYLREHVTPYYREHPDQFDIENVTSDEVYSASILIDRNDLRLTLDEANDYELLDQVYTGLEESGLLPIESVIEYIDENGIHRLNKSVEQKDL